MGSAVGRCCRREFRAPVVVGWAVLLLLSVPAPLLLGAYGSENLRTSSSLPSGLVAEGTPNNTTTLSYADDGPAEPISSAFWGIDGNGALSSNASQADAINASPVNYVVWPGGDLGDRYDVLTNQVWSTDGTPSTVRVTSEQQFVTWCESIGCHAILQVPGEIDNASLAAAVVNYTLNKLHFAPAYWEIGNEPALWTEWKIAWPYWGTSSPSRTSPTGYADEVQAYIAAMRAVNSSLQFIGLPGSGSERTEESYLNATVEVDGPDLAAVAIHVYPAGEGNESNPSLGQFYATLGGATSLTARVPEDRAAIAAACHGTCGPIPLFVTEFNSGTITGAGGWDGYLNGTANVPYVAAEVAEGLNLSLANMDLYDDESTNYPGAWINATTGAIHPVETLYTALFPHLGTVDQPVAASPSPPRGFAVALTENPTLGTWTLLAANANANETVRLNLSSLGFPAGTLAAHWLWNASAGAGSSPVEGNWTHGSPNLWTLPPASVGLVESTIYRVHVRSYGLPSGIAWAVDVDSTTLGTTAASLNVWLVNGTYNWQAPDIAGYEAEPAGGSFAIAGTDENLTITWTPELYPVTFTETGITTGTSWSVTLNGSQSSSISSTITFYEPNGNYSAVIAPVPGFTPNRTSILVQVRDAGTSYPTSWTAVPYLVEFTEIGLAPGTDWSVMLAGAKESSSSPEIDFEEPNGTYTYAVAGLPGLSASPAVGGVTVDGEAAGVVIGWSPREYSIIFLANGLPAGTNWSVTLADATTNSSEASISFVEPNGTYAASVTSAPGYAPSPARLVVRVLGANLTFAITWQAAIPAQYGVAFDEIGLAPGIGWSLTFGDSVYVSAVASIHLLAENGTYSFEVAPLPGYACAYPTGNVTIDGANYTVTVSFAANSHPSGAVGGWPSLLSPVVLGGAVAVIAGISIVSVLLWARRRPPRRTFRSR
jgi:hypothetical protein